MLALVAGTGELPAALVARLTEAGEDVLICQPEGVAPELPASMPRLTFRLETLGSLIAALQNRGVGRVCMAGAVRRPVIDPALIDPATAPLLPRLTAALGQGDDGALRALIGIFEEAGLQVVAAHQIAPDLLPQTGIHTRATPDDAARAGAALGEATVAEMGRADLGQACVIGADRVIAREDEAGTDAMLATLGAVPPGAVLFKAPKPGQDRRADLPVIGPETARAAARAGLAGIVIEAGGVMVMNLAEVIEILNAAGLFLWVRPKGAT
ncbi:MAG: DUF1009 domain-containing protein [Limimaricola sp.]|uniref:LpxI family protein n=1 Tax=Limimaricola sp. TaxID=2211665 RepID=UPI001DC21699|nr:UDP-2,3-diacylglucosamine diphosphatase LpxI [Limimaricola sp.]MBI1418018.1 DUF1009 domain-containing protein [Limimaricola sp.]